MRTRAAESPPTPFGAELKRFSELLQAFSDLATVRDDLQLRGSAEPPPMGFAVRLQPEPTSAGVELCLWTDGGKLSTWAGDGHHPLQGHDDRYVYLELTEGFRWGVGAYPDARQLAAALLGCMEREIAASRRRATLEVS